MKRILVLTVSIAALVFAVGAEAAPKTATLVIRHQLHGATPGR